MDDELTTVFDNTFLDVPTNFATAGADWTGSVGYYDFPNLGDQIPTDPYAQPVGSVTTSDPNFYSAPVGPQLPTPVQPAPQLATAGSPQGSTWQPLLGAGAPLLGVGVKALANSGLLQNTSAPGASVAARPAGAPLRSLFDTVTNQGVTGKQVVVGGAVLLAFFYAIRRFV